MTKPESYPLGRTEAETRRLILQAHIYGPLTRRFFQAAGIGAGMKVLDIGSGAGDVAMLAADLVGPRGRVVGVDMNGEILETARRRAAAAGFANVTFHAGDVREIAFEDEFDAVVGRWVLMYVPDPAALLRSLIARLRPGGIVAFHENDFTYPPTTFPATESMTRLQKWSIPPPGTPGPSMRMGTKLYATYLAAGLPGPNFVLEAPAGGGADWPGYEYAVETLRSLLPALQEMIGLDPAEVDIDTLTDRLRQEVVANQGIQMLPLMFGAW